MQAERSSAESARVKPRRTRKVPPAVLAAPHTSSNVKPSSTAGTPVQLHHGSASSSSSGLVNGRGALFQPGWQAYVDYFTATADVVSGCAAPYAENLQGVGPGGNSANRLPGRIISGPAWGGFGIHPHQLQQLMKQSSRWVVRLVSWAADKEQEPRVEELSRSPAVIR